MNCLTNSNKSAAIQNRHQTSRNKREGKKTGEKRTLPRGFGKRNTYQLDVVFRQISTFLDDSMAIVYAHCFLSLPIFFENLALTEKPIYKHFGKNLYLKKSVQNLFLHKTKL